MGVDRYDAIIVGSGATGGWAAKDLTERGLRVALLEAGPMLPTKDIGVPLRGAGAFPSPSRERQSVQQHCYAYNTSSAPFFVDDLDNPYSHPEAQPFRWIRSRQVGGRMLLWDRVCLRMSDHEFKAASEDGVGDDWPICHDDLSPHYGRVERFLEVVGTPEGMSQLPDGDFVEPPPFSAGETHLKQAVEGRWPTRTVTVARTALAPPDATLKAAMRTDRLTLLADSVASRILVHPGGVRTRGVAYVDRISGSEREVEAQAIFLCASTIESTRLLLNSATEDHPDGLANSSGLLGRYLMDHTFNVGFDGVAAAPPRDGADPLSFGCFIPGFRNVTENGVDFIRSYGVAMQIRPAIGGLLRRIRNRGRRAGGHFWMRALGEVLPNRDNRVTVDPERVDAWGIPIASIECEYGGNERRMAADQFAVMTEIVEAAGMQPRRSHPDLAPPGLSIHEVGGARMGADPETSVLDPFNRAWDVDNLFVTDGSCFVSSGYQNPTLTMMAITARACEHHVERVKRGEPWREPIRT